jgi:adenylosuccinate synthase
MTQYSDLPIQAQQYIDRIEELVKTPIVLISTGPERDQTIVLNNSLF